MNLVRKSNPAAAALVLALAACEGPAVNREVERSQTNRISFAISDINTPIPWVVRDPARSGFSFEGISPQQFTERTQIHNLQLDSFLPGSVTGFEIVGASTQSERGTLVVADLHINISGSERKTLWEIQYSPQGKLVSMGNLPLEDLMPLLLRNGR